MKDIADKRRDRKAAADKMTEAATAIEAVEAAGHAADSEEMTAAVAAFEAAQATFNAADAAVKRAEATEAAQLAAADPAGGDQGRAGSVAGSQPARAKVPGEEAIEVGFMVHALATNKGDRDKAAAALERDGHSGISAALSGATEGAGGVTIPRAQAAELIPLLRSRVIVRQAGARVLDMPAGELRHARQSGAATAGYVGENAPATASAQTFEPVQQTFNKLTSLVPISNSLLRHSSASIALMCRDDLIKVMARREDLAFLRGDGTGNTPKGLTGWCLAGHTLTTVADGASVSVIDATLRAAVSKVEDSDVPMIAPGWAMRAGAKNFLASLRDANGNLLYPSIDARDELHGFPIRTSSQFPNNLGVGGDETEIVFSDFSEIMIGDAMALTVALSTEAGYVDGSGDPQFAFQNDQTLMRAVSEHDLAPSHDEAIAMFNAAGWSL